MKKNILTLRRRIIQSYRQFDLSEATIPQERQFAIFCANLYNALPTLSPKKYLRLFKQVHTNRRLSFLDMEHVVHPDVLHIEAWDDAWVQRLKERPGIICTYHTGSYRLINYLLIQAGVPVSLVVSAKAYQMEKKFKQGLYASLNADHQAHLELINAEESHALIQMASALRKGRILVAYIDGNTGTKIEGSVSRNLMIIKFFEQQMAVRKGLASLAYRLRRPIYPILCRRLRHTGIAYTMHNPIVPLTQEEDPFFVERATKALYKCLEDFLKMYPEQWEGWLYLHDHLVPKEDGKISVNFDKLSEWSLYRNQQKGLLLHRPSYRIYPIKLSDYSRLKQWFVAYL